MAAKVTHQTTLFTPKTKERLLIGTGVVAAVAGIVLLTLESHTNRRK